MMLLTVCKAVVDGVAGVVKHLDCIREADACLLAAIEVEYVHFVGLVRVIVAKKSAFSRGRLGAVGYVLVISGGRHDMDVISELWRDDVELVVSRRERS